MAAENKKLRLVLVYQMKTQTNTPHFGILSLAAYVNQKFPLFKIKVIEDANPLAKILSFKPDIVGITSSSPDYNLAITLAENIKKHIKSPIILGGIHITTCPNSFHKAFDIGVIGEGELTLGELLKLYVKKRKFNKKDLKNINGLIYLNNRKLVTTKPRKLIENIDELPFPAREIIPMEKHHFANQINLYGIKRMIIMTTTRGCPYHCVYCASPAHWTSYRFHSVGYIVREIEHLINKYKVDGITLWDDLFITPKSRLMQLVAEIKKRGWEKTVAFTGQARSNLVDEDIVKALKSINVRRLSFGFESYSPKMLNYLKANSVSVKQNIAAIKLCHKYGIEVTSGLIVGTPGETPEDLEINYQAMKKYPLESTNIYLLTAYPGTKIWQLATQNKLVSDNMDMGRLHTDIPFGAFFKFWKKDRFYFLQDHVFLNQAMRHHNAYLFMILKLNLLAICQNYFYYLKHFLANPKTLLNICQIKL